MISREHTNRSELPHGDNLLPRQQTATTEKGQIAIAERVMKFRKERAITQVDMAKKLKTSQSIYCRYERGEMRIHAELILALAKILEVTPNELLGVTKSGNPATPLSDEVIPKKFLRAMRGVDKLTRTDQDSLLRLIDTWMSASRNKNERRGNKTLDES